jgi:opacity protein-like surface antigen
VGWTAGAGAELALTTSLTLKGEALYVHLEAPSAIATANNGAGVTPSSFTGNFSDVYFLVARGGLNYRF